MRRPDWLVFGLLALVFAASSLALLARAPQNPDGAELIATAVRGGVLHPPGFPLQAWLDRALVMLWPAEPARVLAAQSLACFSAALFFLGLTLRALGATTSGASLGVVCFALYPPAWRLAVQPEKYALLFLLMAIFASCALRPRVVRLRRVAVLSLLFGLIIAQHLIGLVALPLLLAPARRAPLRQRGRSALVFAAGVFVIVGPLYLSLLALTHAAAWPDWGKLQSVSDVLAHLTRRDLGLFKVDPTLRGGLRGITVAVDALVSTFSYGLLLLPFGLWSLWSAWRRRRDAAAAAWLLALGGSLALVIKARIGGDADVAVAWLERYTAVLVFFLSGVIAFGWDGLARRLPSKLRWLAPAAVGALALVLCLAQRRSVDLSQDASLELYSRATGALLPDRAIYVGGNDLEEFLGARTAKGLRFPLAAQYEWYLERALPLLEPRLSLTAAEGADPFKLVNRAFELGFPVYSTDRRLLDRPGRRAVARGLFWAVDPRDGPQKGPRKADARGAALASAVSLCSVLKGLSFDPPPESHHYSRYLWRELTRAFIDTSLELQRNGDARGVDKTANVAVALVNGRSAASIAKACAGLEHSAKLAP